MGVTQSMDLILVKKWEIWGREILCLDYIEKWKEISRKNDGGLSKYGFGFSKEIKEFGAEKSWGLNKVWIWIV